MHSALDPSHIHSRVTHELCLFLGVTFYQRAGSFGNRLPGATFYRRRRGNLPRSRPSRWIPAMNEPVAQALILVAEDDDLTRELLVEVLRRGGHRIIDVASGVEAIEQLKAQRFDLV